MSQQKDTDPEEYKKLHSEKEAHLKRIQQLTEDTARLKAEVARSVPAPPGTVSGVSISLPTA